MMQDLKEAVTSLKVANKLALVLGGPQTLAVSSAKMIDALDAAADFNIGLATNDVWTATAGLLNFLVDVVPEIRQMTEGVSFNMDRHSESMGLLKKADELWHGKSFKESASCYFSGIKLSQAHDKYNLQEILK